MLKNSIRCIYSADLSPGIALNKVALLLILQNNVKLFQSYIIIAAITSVSKKSESSHYHLNDRCGLVKPSVVMLEQIRTIDKSS